MLEILKWDFVDHFLDHPKIKVEPQLLNQKKCEDDDLYLRFECDTQYNRISFYVIYGGENNICQGAS